MKVLRKKSKTFGDLLPKRVREKILEAGHEQIYTDGEIIQQRGDTWPGISIVVSGEAIAANVGRDGSITPSSLIRPGDTFGEYTTFLDLHRTHSIWAKGQTRLRHIKRNRFLSLADEEPVIYRAMLTLTLARNHELVSILDAQRRLSLPARIARALMTEIDPSAKTATIMCRQEDLASMLGLSRVAIGKALEKLAAKGLIKTGYGKIEVLDAPKLARFLAREDPLSPIE